MRTAVVHDYLAQSGGAERVAAALHELFPDAPLYASVYDSKASRPYFAEIDVRTSFLQRSPLSSRRLHKLALPFYPAAFESFDFQGYDLVLSSSSSFAKGVITPPEACHVCYCHTPARFAWRQHEYLSQSRRGRLFSLLMQGMLRRLRSWDLESSQRPGFFIANSENVARRNRKYYRREAAAVIPPPSRPGGTPRPPRTRSAATSWWSRAWSATSAWTWPGYSAGPGRRSGSWGGCPTPRWRRSTPAAAR